MKTKLIAMILALTTVLMLAAPTFAVTGPVMSTVRFKYYTGQTALFTALVAGDIDFMAWPLSRSQYITASTDSNIVMAPYFDMGDYEISFNSNATMTGHDARSPTNYTAFRNAGSCLINKDGLMAGPDVAGFGTRIDTPMARPVLDDWVNFSVSQYDSNGVLLGNYPWEYNVTKAMQILYTNGWYNTATYPTFASLLTAYGTGLSTDPLYVSAGETSIAVYPPGHSLAGTPVEQLIGYARSDHAPRLAAGRQLTDGFRSIGVAVGLTEAPSSVCSPAVMYDRVYHFYTNGWSFSSTPLHFYSMYTPIGIAVGGPNFYMVQDSELTYWAEQEYPQASSIPASKAAAKICQGLIVERSYTNTLYSNRAYLGYRKGMLSVLTTKGYGLSSAVDYTFMDTYHQTFPTKTVINHGTLNPPEQINPIFSSWLWDYMVIDRMFTSYLIFNPYRPDVAGKSPAGREQPWMAKDWLVGTAPDGNATLELWFRTDVFWHDGTPFTVDDFNYTIFLMKAYEDSWGYSDMANVVSVTKYDNYHCKVFFNIPTFWVYLTPGYDMVPKHIYEKIPNTNASDPTLGPHGYYPGQNEINPDTGVAFTREEVWVGTNMWKYVAGSETPGDGGGITLEAFNQFWMKVVPGDIDFNYLWDAGPNPQTGHYSVGLSDLVLLANAYGTTGQGAIPGILPGVKGAWNPAADLAAPSGVIGLSDLVTLAKNYGATWGSYT